MTTWLPVSFVVNEEKIVEKLGGEVIVSRTEEVEKLLLSIAPAGICDDCIAAKLKFTQRQTANQISRKLESSKRFDRRTNYCPSCGTIKKIVRLIIKKLPTVNSAENIQQSLPSARASQPRITQSQELPLKPGLEDITAIGFKQIGSWLIENRNLLLHQDQMKKASPALYAFVRGGCVMYVGKTSQLLAKRLYFYAKPGRTQSTNIRLNALLSRSLQDGCSVEIFGCVNMSANKVGIFDVDMAAGLEDSIIHQLQPLWNDRK